MKMTHLERVKNLIQWHRFVSQLMAQVERNLKEFTLSHDHLFYGDLRKYTMLYDKLNWITQQQYAAEHDLISTAIKYQVPHIKLLKNHPEDFYTLLEKKAIQIDKGEVLLIRKC